MPHSRLGSTPGSYTPGGNHSQSPYPLPRIPMPNRSSLFSAGGLTFPSPPPQQPQQPQQVSDDIKDLSTFEYIALGLAGGIWMGANFVYKGIGSVLNYAASSLGYSQSAATAKSPRPMKRKNRDHRHDPLGTRSRPKSPITPKTPMPLKSAMAPGRQRSLVALGTSITNGGGVPAGQGQLGVLPHHAGETPFSANSNVRDAEVDGNAEATGVAHQNSQGMFMDADGDIQMVDAMSPISELPPSPQIQEPKANDSKRVRFAGIPGGETTNAVASSPTLDTTAVDRKPPTGAGDPFGSREDFRKYFNQTKYKRWIDFLQSQGIPVKEYRENLHSELSLPTEVILRLYSEREKSPEHWKTFVTCLSHDGFLERMGIVVPKYKYGPPPKSWEPDELPLQIPYDNPYQQQDGRCCFCRGFKWAGTVETRSIARYGDEVECRSRHHSAIPYTEREIEDFRKGVFDSFWRRCCQESRWDWVFEEPVPNEPTEVEWQIPQWDVRLRHFRRFKNPRTGEAFGEGLSLPQKNQLLELYELQTKLSRQDLAAKLFIDAVEEVGNEELARDLRKMDKERKRLQVQTEFLCVRQVRLMVGESPTKSKNFNDMVKKLAEEKPEEDFDFLGLETWAAESPAPERGCDPNEPVVPNSTHVADREKERRSAAEWARFELFKKRHEIIYWVAARKHYDALASEDLDPEELAIRTKEYNQNLWEEFLVEEKCLQEEKEQDERSRMKKQRPPIPPMEMPKSGWDRRKIAEKHGISPIRVTGEGGTLDKHLKQRAVIRHHAKEYRRLGELQRARRLASGSVPKHYGRGRKTPGF